MTASSAPSQILDLASAQEFMREAAEQVSDADMQAIQEELREKSRRFRALLGGGRDEVAGLPAGVLQGVLRSVFPVRRKARRVLEATGPVALAAAMADLLHAEASLEERLPAFCARVQDLEGDLRLDLATELLHFTFPERWWLWTRWMWDPKNGTGALRLVTMDDSNLRGDDDVQTYLNVGRAVAFVQQTAAAAGLHRLGHGPFGVDVFLANVYGVYLYTVLKMRMTREFNRCVPELPQLARRLLGIHGLEV